MKKWIIATSVCLAFAAALFVEFGTPSAQDFGVLSLRGALDINENNTAPDIKPLAVGQIFNRAYRQQPPLIPHKIEKYQINVKVNQCLRCHDWPYSVQENAPKVSETHYVDRNGIAHDKVTRNRWFCTQCHVTQVQTGELVPNIFRSSVEVD